MAGILEEAGLPPLLQTVMKLWVRAIEIGASETRAAVIAATSRTAASLKGRVVVSPALDVAITEAAVASLAFAAALDRQDAETVELRAVALAALAVVIEQLRTAEPSEDTRALGLGW